MKLLLCKECHDIFKLVLQPRTCICGKTKGVIKIENNVSHAYYEGEYAVPLGISNTSFRTAVINRPRNSPGKEFTAFVIPYNSFTCHEIKSENKIKIN